MSSTGMGFAPSKQMRSARGKVAVITGASGGLGREVAVQLAAQGCTIVAAARREAALEETVRSCRAAGGRATRVVTDVTREEEVQRLAQTALQEAGHIDIWVNNAGVTLFGPLEGIPFDQHRRVIETNLYGSMFGARAILPIFRRQQQGVLINVGSILSKIGQPFVPSYVISKFALRGLSEALRAELANEPDIHVCTLLPYAINTQHFEAGGNELGRHVYTMPPGQSPEKVASILIELASPRSAWPYTLSCRARSSDS
jgi:NAD(P)-dependent dehydrogenase (short-subunit alcohol dehydrogenase family)